MKTTIQVTQEDIEHGWRHSQSWCPIAQAILRTIPDIHYVRVTPYRFACLIDRKGYNVVTRLPKKATDFIHNYDANQDVRPFEFEVNFRGESVGETEC